MKIMGITIKKAPTFLPGNLFLGSFQKANGNASNIGSVQNVYFKWTKKGRDCLKISLKIQVALSELIRF